MADRKRKKLDKVCKGDKGAQRQENQNKRELE